MPMVSDFIEYHALAEARDVLIFTCVFFTSPSVVRLSDTGNFVAVQLAVGTVNY